MTQSYGNLKRTNRKHGPRVSNNVQALLDSANSEEIRELLDIPDVNAGENAGTSYFTIEAGNLLFTGLLQVNNEFILEILNKTDDSASVLRFPYPDGDIVEYNFLPIAGASSVAAVITKATTGNPVIAVSGVFCENTFDNNFKVYADGAWRTIATW